MKLLGALRKRRAIRSYARRLPKMLCDDYGFSQAYSPRQIMATIERNRLSRDHSNYAISMFSDRVSFAQYYGLTGEIGDFETMRAEVAVRYFSGNVNFTVSDIMHTISDAFHDASSGGWHGDGGGHGGHGDGGGGH